MSLSDRQRDDLNRSILSYLQSQNLTSSLKVLSKELSIDATDPSLSDKKYVGLLEKKWLSVIRLQKKIMDLEQSLSELQSSIPSHYALTNGKVDLTTWIPRAPARHTLSGHRQPITSVSFHPSFSIIATSSEDSTIKLWDWETGDFEQTLKSHTKSVTDIDFSWTGLQQASGADTRRSTLLASCSNDLTIKIWDADNDYKCTKTLHGHDHVVSSVRFITNSDDHLVSVSRDRSIKIWDVHAGFCMRTIGDAHGDWIRSISPSPDGDMLLTTGSDQLAKIFTVQGEMKMELRAHDHVVECGIFAPPASASFLCKLAGIPTTKPPKFVATASRDRTIRLWNVETGSCISTLTGHDNWIRALVFHPDGKYLISASDDKSIKIWDLEQAGRCCRTIDDAHGHFISCLRWGLSASQRLHQMTRKADGQDENQHGKGRYVLASGGVDQVIKIWTP